MTRQGSLVRTLKHTIARLHQAVPATRVFLTVCTHSALKNLTTLLACFGAPVFREAFC